MFLLYGLVEVKNRAEQGLEWRARETRINRRFRSSREQGSNAAWLAFLGLPAARRKDDTFDGVPQLASSCPSVEDNFQ